MIKMFCDVCKKEIKRNYVSERWHGSNDKIYFEVIVGGKSGWNIGEICLKCLLKTINEVAKSSK